jgi:hypothetical protein
MDGLLRYLLVLFGFGFLVANLLALADLFRYRLRKRSALLIWRNPRPKTFGFSLGLAVVLGLLLVFRLTVQHLPITRLFGEAMMFVYYGYAWPLSSRISRGFYEAGVWSDTGFMPWSRISAVSWRDTEGQITLMLISHAASVARRLDVPGHLYGQARRVLLDRVRAHDIRIGGAGLDLGSREETDAV